MSTRSRPHSTYLDKHRSIIPTLRPLETPMYWDGRCFSPRINPARVTPEPQLTITVPPRTASSGILAASFWIAATDSVQSKPKGSRIPPCSSTRRRASAKEILIRPARTGSTSAPSSRAIRKGSGMFDPRLAGYATMTRKPGSSLPQTAIPWPSADIRVSQQPMRRTPSR
jgi:hypothetical protein